MSPIRHAVNANRHELTIMISARALLRLVLLSLWNLAKLLVSAADSEDRSLRTLSMYSIPSFDATRVNARWRYPCCRIRIDRSISACFELAKDSSCDTSDRSLSARFVNATRMSARSVPILTRSEERRVGKEV